MSEPIIDRAIVGVADRTPVDWDALQNEASSEEDRGQLKYLRVLNGLAQLHRALDESDRVPAGGETLHGDGHGAASRQALTQWGKYRLVQLVGEGAYGSVYRAWDPDLELDVAIKILHRRIADARLKDELLREGRALAKVRHDNVVRVLSVESHDDQIALRMEFVHGETLDDVVHRHGTLNAREAALIGEDVGRALAAFHLAGFVHRDVKAKNVMRENAGRIVLMDFGAGRHAEDLKIPGRIANVGTPIYMAPEVIAGQPATVCSDVYSVGVLLYYLVTGGYPVEGQSIDEIELGHLSGRRRSLTERRPDLPSSFVQVVERALAADPAMRYATASALVEALCSVSEAIAPRRAVSRSVRERLGATVLISLLGAISLGLLNSLEFNSALGRTGFVQENVVDWAWWGLRSSLGSILTLLLTVFALTLFLGLRKIALTASAKMRALDGAVASYLMRAGRALKMDDPSMRGAVLLLVSGVLLVAAWNYFAQLMANLLLEGDLMSASAAKLRLLSPANRPYHYLYRKTFSGVMIFAGAAWYVVWRFGSKPRDLLQSSLVAGCAAVFLLAVCALDLPFRIVYHPIFDAVIWQKNECYLLGERPDEVLLFCPALDPRNRVVKKAGADLEYSGRKENIFTWFDGTTVLRGAVQK